MPDPGAGKLDAAFSGQAQAQPEIDILVIAEERLGKSADTLEHIPAIERGSSAGPHDFGILGHARGRVQPVSPPGKTERAVVVAGTVEQRGIALEQLGRTEHGDPVIPGNGLGKGLQPVRLGKGIRVQQGKPGPARLPGQQVVAGGESDILRAADQLRRNAKTAQVDLVSVRGRVVEHQDVEIAEALRRQSRQATGQVRARFIGDDKDGDQRRSGYHAGLQVADFSRP